MFFFFPIVGIEDSIIKQENTKLSINNILFIPNLTKNLFSGS
jgi:hypothetical protein